MTAPVNIQPLYEQGGASRAQYGKQTLQQLSQKLSAEYGKGFSPQSLWSFSQFYLEFPILSALRRELHWSHYKALGCSVLNNVQAGEQA